MNMQRIRVVLVRPQSAGNIGAVARLMENFDAGPLYLVAPQADPQSPEAVARSTHGEQRLRAAKVVPSIAEALAGAGTCIAASRRPGPVHQAQVLHPRDIAPALSESELAGDAALLFGPEDLGLSREDLLHCDRLMQIPASEHFPTLNLSHAVGICLYELFVGLHSTSAGEQSEPVVTGDPADGQLMQRLMGKLTAALDRVGYLHSDKPDHLLFPIRAILSKARLTVTEAQILMGLAQQIEEFAKFGRRHR